MSENGTLRIHTQMPPRAEQESAKQEQGKRRWRRARRERARPPVRRKPGFSDRLLRNSAIACALLLGVLALGNLRQPWAERAAEGIQRALTMHINLDDSLGELTFVKQLMPESALVFLNVSGSGEMTRPAGGAATHPWSALQPWMMFEGGDVFAAGAGTVTAVSTLSEGKFGLLIDHGDGLESVYAGLDAALVQSGDAVSRGQQLGDCTEGLYFELRQDGEPIDPTQRLGL